MSKTKLYKYQEKGVRKIQHFKGRALLADEMGLGKTLEALTWLEQNPDLRPAIVVCPASLKWVWETEASLHLGMRSEILNGQKPPKKGFIDKHALIIINYEILQYWLRYLRRLNPKVLLLDEVHYIKTKGTRKHPIKRTNAVMRLAKRIPHIIGIGGTPFVNGRPYELWPILHLLRPDHFESLFVYKWRYCNPVRKPWGWEYKGANNLRELHRKLNSLMMIRRLKKDVLSELPAKIRQIIPMDIENRNEYEDALNNFITWITKKSTIKAERAKRAERLVQMGYLKRLAAELKMKFVLQWIDDFLEESNGKLVLGAIHKNIIKQIHSKYRHISVVVDGSITGKKRKLAIKIFQRNKSIRLFIGSIQAAGVGITLTAASTVAFLEIPWTPAEVIQFEDRIHRIGQKKAAMIYYLIAKGTIEEKLCELLQKKQAILSATLDGKKQINRLEIFDELQRELLK